MFSVVILTLNEERNLPGCLASVAGCDDIVVLDSGSTDATAEMARTAGARVFVNRFEDFARQRNYAHGVAAFRHPWVFHLDADEQFTPDLFEECQRYPDLPDVDGCYVAPRMMFEGRWIPRCTDFPAWQARFVKATGFRFVQVGHGQREEPGMRMRRLQHGYRHDLSATGTENWLAKHRRYAREEALHTAATPVNWAGLRSPDPLIRRRTLKQLSYRLPGRPALRFLYQYVWRRGLLDGRPGFNYCRLLARYEGFAADEYRKIRRRTP